MERTFRRALGGIYLCAFLSLAVQMRGLFGARGILPLAQSLVSARGRLGFGAYFTFPSLLWISASDTALWIVALVGIGASLSLLADRYRRVAAITAWIAYLSFVSVGTPFLHYQWDSLLLETGFLGIALAFAPGERWVTWAFRFLLFRLMLASGAVKLLSGDPAWRTLEALRFHYETQPLPTALAWYLHQLPPFVQRASCVFTFVVELALPWLLFAGRRARWIAAAGFAILQLLIALSGNYGFFNLLTLALGFWWITETKPNVPSRVGRALAGVSLGLGALILVETLVGLPGPLSTIVEAGESWGIASHYGLFAVMTTERDEVVIEGSEDGAHWQAYGFRWKPGDPQSAPKWVAPHLPRLDWQLWFAALDLRRAGYWLESLAERLRSGEPTVLALLAENPFPHKPPAHVRLALYRYRFTTRAEARETHAWWVRELKGVTEGI